MMLLDLISKRGAIENLLFKLEFWAWIFAVIVAVGVVGEAYFGVRILWNNHQLKAIQKQIDSEAEKTVQADKAEIAALQNKADQANQLADKLEHNLGHRIVSQTLRKKMVESLSKYQNQRFAIGWPVGDTEAQILAANFSNSLINCGWLLDGSQKSYPNYTKDNIMTGIVIFTNKADGDLAAANALCDVIDVSIWAQDADVPLGTIVIIIPSKPPDPATIQDIVKKMSQMSEFADRASNLSAALRSYEGQIVSLYSPVNDNQADQLAVSISGALQAAGWKIIDGSPAHQNYATNFENIEIGISEDDATSHTIPAAAIPLLEVLKSNRLIKKDAQLRELKGLPRGEICIRTGLSPFNENP